MGILDFFKSIFIKEKAGQELIIDERNKIKNDIAKNFREKLNFTDLEIKEVLDIVTVAEAEIDEIKRSIARVNYNNPNTERDVENATNQINEISKQMAESIQKKAREIVERKNKLK